jgi:LacI family transcriptional regulator
MMSGTRPVRANGSRRDRPARRTAPAKATIIDIARAAGVSKSTVSLVLKASPLVREATRERVVREMNALGYVYNRGAANLRRARSNIVGVVINDLSNPFFAELAIGLERVLQEAGYVSFLANSDEKPERQAEVIRSMREHGAAGIVLSPALDTNAEEVARLATPPMPIILVVRRIPGARASLVASDNAAGAARATAHLIGLGHQRIAFVGGLTRMVVRQDRVSGYTKAMNAAGLSVEPGLNVETMPTKAGGFDGMRGLIAAVPRPTAVVCFNDVVAIGAMLAVARQGLMVGRDIAITGFDDTAEARHVSPALTTVAVDAAGLGRRAAQMILRQAIDGERRIESYIGETRLVIRESCGATQVERMVS